MVTDDDQNVVWQGDNDPFGKATETVAVAEQNLRFPGQYLDRESGLHYNYFRVYDSSTGRYVESDLIGLNGGMLTYGYAYANPIVYADPYGLCPMCIVAVVHWTRNWWNSTPAYEVAQKYWSKAEDTRFHKQKGATGNEKITSPRGFSEAVYCNGNLVEDSLNMGTFNFAPANFAGVIPHAIVDILPWLVLGNDPLSMFTNAPDRFSSTASAALERASDFLLVF